MTEDFLYLLQRRHAACRSKPHNAVNEQGEDCSNDVTQMSWVQICRLKIRVQIRSLYVLPPPPPPLPPSSQPSIRPRTQSLSF